MTEVTFYSSFDEMMEDLRKAMKQADGRVKPAQAAAKPGQYFINFRYGKELPIFGQILETDEEDSEDPALKIYRLTRAYSVACEMEETGDIHVSEIDAIIDKELFEYYKERNWRPLGRRERIQRRIDQLLEELRPLSQHSELHVLPICYDSSLDTFHLEAVPKSSLKWADTAYQFAMHENMKYDRDRHIHKIDGQPRVSYSGMVWVRYLAPFIDGSKVAIQILSQQPSHEDAEAQLAKFYGLFQKKNGMKPVEVFKKYL